MLCGDAEGSPGHGDDDVWRGSDCGDVGGCGEGVFDRHMVRLVFLVSDRWLFDDCVGEWGCDGLSRKMSSFSRGLRPAHIVHLRDERKFM